MLSALGLAHLLEDHLLGGLRRNPPSTSVRFGNSISMSTSASSP
jgi:hypothetical protein